VQVCSVMDGHCKNAAHLQHCPWVGDGLGRSTEQMWSDEDWCEKVAEFIL